MRRREFVGGLSGALISAVAAPLGGQPANQQTNFTPMDGSAHRPVKLPPKPGASPRLSDVEIKKMELGLKCQCTCSLDLYTCYTTDKACPVSPAMHADVMTLAGGGYSAQEIVEAFVDVYGERVRMAPNPIGFNLIAYIAPFAVAGAAALFVGMWISRNIRRRRDLAATPSIPTAANASSEEMARIESALRDDS